MTSMSSTDESSTNKSPMFSLWHHRRTGSINTLPKPLSQAVLEIHNRNLSPETPTSPVVGSLVDVARHPSRQEVPSMDHFPIRKSGQSKLVPFLLAGRATASLTSLGPGRIISNIPIRHGRSLSKPCGTSSSNPSGGHALLQETTDGKCFDDP